MVDDNTVPISFYTCVACGQLVYAGFAHQCFVTPAVPAQPSTVWYSNPFTIVSSDVVYEKIREIIREEIAKALAKAQT